MSDKVKVTTKRPVMFEGQARTTFETTEQHRRELEKLGYLESDAAPAPAPAPAPGEGEGGDAAKADLAARATAFIEGTVPEVTGRIEGADDALLQAALAAENATEKPRKGVVDALTAALTPQA